MERYRVEREKQFKQYETMVTPKNKQIRNCSRLTESRTTTPSFELFLAHGHEDGHRREDRLRDENEDQQHDEVVPDKPGASKFAVYDHYTQGLRIEMWPILLVRPPFLFSAVQSTFVGGDKRIEIVVLLKDISCKPSVVSDDTTWNNLTANQSWNSN
jgi:hypothetical protein